MPTPGVQEQAESITEEQKRAASTASTTEGQEPAASTTEEQKKLALAKYNAADNWMRHFSAIRTSLTPALFAFSILIGKEHVTHPEWPRCTRLIVYGCSAVAWLSALCFFVAFTFYKECEREWKKRLEKWILNPDQRLPNKGKLSPNFTRVGAIAHYQNLAGFLCFRRSCAGLFFPSG